MVTILFNRLMHICQILVYNAQTKRTFCDGNIIYTRCYNLWTEGFKIHGECEKQIKDNRLTASNFIRHLTTHSDMLVLQIACEQNS